MLEHSVAGKNHMDLLAKGEYFMSSKERKERKDDSRERLYGCHVFASVLESTPNFTLTLPRAMPVIAQWVFETTVVLTMAMILTREAT